MDVLESGTIASVKSNSDNNQYNVLAITTTTPFDKDAVARTGNYYEVEIIKEGSKDIGVGLCVKDSFSLKNEMPGWNRDRPDSYGYHGDDGRKFGPRATGGTWPVWKNGDVVGCGVDYETSTIFFTLNGEMLGVGFEDIEHTSLTPVLGFVLHHVEKRVRVNFGAQPFKYTGPEVVMGEVASSYGLSLLTLEGDSDGDDDSDGSKSDVDQFTPTAASTAGRSRRNSAESECDLAPLSSTEEELDTLPVYRAKMAKLQQDLRLLTADLASLASMRSYSMTVLRFLLAMTCKNCVAQGGSVPTSGGGGVSRQLSAYGTPCEATAEDGAMLQGDVVSFLIKELERCSLYLEVEAGRVAVQAQVPVGDHTSRPPPRVLSVLPLEHLEVETVAFSHLLCLCTVVHFSSVVAEGLKSPLALKVVFALMRHGSPRIQATATSILRLVLPQVLPEEVERALNHVDSSPGSPVSPTEQPCRRPSRRMPDTGVRQLAAKVQDAVEICSADRWFRDASVPGPSLDRVGLLHPVGSGEQAQRLASQCIAVLQKLMEAPSWTELVSCYMTDAIRGATSVLDAVLTAAADPTSSVGDGTNGQLHEGIAAVTLLCGLSCKVVGGRVQDAAGRQGVLVSVDGAEPRMATVLFDGARSTNADGSPNLQEPPQTEDVLESVLSAVLEGVRVDLSSISQPLLQLLNSLNRRLLVLFFVTDDEVDGGLSAASMASAHDRVECLAVPRSTKDLLVRLTAVVATALATLMRTQTDVVVDGISEADALKLVLSASLQAVAPGLPPDLPQLLGVWNMTQARVLEGNRHGLWTGQLDGDGPGGDAPRAPTAIVGELSVAVGTAAAAESRVVTLGEHLAALQEAQQLLSTPPDSQRPRAFSIDVPGPDKDRKEYLNRLVEYFKDPAEAAAFLEAYSPSPEKGVGLGGSSPAAAAAASLEGQWGPDEETTAELDDAEVEPQFTNDHFLNDGEVVGAEESKGGSACKPMAAGGAGSTASALYLYDLEPIADQGDSSHHGFFACATEADGSVRHAPTVQGFDFSRGAPSQRILARYTEHLGVPLFETVPEEHLRLVKRCCESTVAGLPSFMRRLDLTIAILQMRELASRLVMDGALNFRRTLALGTAGEVLPVPALDTTARAGQDPAWLNFLQLRSFAARVTDFASVEEDGKGGGGGSGGADNDTAMGPETKALFRAVTSSIRRSEQLLSAHPDDDDGAQHDDWVLDTMSDSAAKHISELTVRAARTNPLYTTLSGVRPSKLLTTPHYTPGLGSGVGDSGGDSGGGLSVYVPLVGMSSATQSMFESPHPITCPHTVYGEIRVPAAWRGAKVEFDSRCALPMGGGELCFYSVSTDTRGPVTKISDVCDADSLVRRVAHDKATNDKDDVFQNFFVNNNGRERFFYKFSSWPAFPDLSIVAVRGTFTIDGESSLVAMSTGTGESVGLGEEDSLFNLFQCAEEDDADAEPVLLVADCACVSSGTWVYSASAAWDRSKARGAQGVVAGLVCGEFCTSACGMLNEHPGAWGVQLVPADILDGSRLSGRPQEGDPVRTYLAFKVDVGHVTAYCRTDCSSSTGADGADGAGPTAGEWTLLLDKVPCAEARPAFALSSGYSLKASFLCAAAELDLMALPADFSSQRPVEFHQRPVLHHPSTMWGYRFRLKEVRDWSVRVSRHFDLVWKKVPPPSASGAAEEPIYVWRAKVTNGNYANIGDIVTRSPKPPRGAIQVPKKMCVPPKSFKKVLTSAALDLMVLRAIPSAPGFVSLGDVVAHNSAGPPPLIMCMCVPTWAVKECSIGDRIYVPKKGAAADAKKVEPFSFWSVRNHLGTFVASKSLLQTRKCERVVDGVPLDGVPQGYALQSNYGSVLTGEWEGEEDVTTAPSILWSCTVVDYLLSTPLPGEDQPKRRERDNARVCCLFDRLIKYVRSPHSPAPLKLVPAIIRLLRRCGKANLRLDLDVLVDMCRTITERAVTKGESKRMTPTLLRLVDLAVEVQSAVLVNTAAARREAEAAAEAEGCDGGAADAALDLEGVLADTGKKSGWDRLGYLLSFFAAMGVGQYARPGAKALDSFGARSEFDIAQGLVNKVWFNHASSCCFTESLHPRALTAEGEPQVQTISFPGASKISITMDSRCSFGPYDTLTISGGGNVWTLGPQTQKNTLVKTMVIPGSEALLTYTASATAPVVKADVGDDVGGDDADWCTAGEKKKKGREKKDDEGPAAAADDTKKDNKGDEDDEAKAGGTASASKTDILRRDEEPWGWAAVVHASGPIHESAVTEIDLDAHVRDLSVCAPTAMAGASKGMTAAVTTATTAAKDGEGEKSTTATATTASTAYDTYKAASEAAEQAHAPRLGRVVAAVPDDVDPALFLQMVFTRGRLVDSGELSVPRADTMDVVVDRPHVVLESDKDKNKDSGEDKESTEAQAALKLVRSGLQCEKIKDSGKDLDETKDGTGDGTDSKEDGEGAHKEKEKEQHSWDFVIVFDYEVALLEGAVEGVETGAPKPCSTTLPPPPPKNKAPAVLAKCAAGADGTVDASDAASPPVPPVTRMDIFVSLNAADKEHTVTIDEDSSHEHDSTQWPPKTDRSLVCLAQGPAAQKYTLKTSKTAYRVYALDKAWATDYRRVEAPPSTPTATTTLAETGGEATVPVTGNGEDDATGDPATRRASAAMLSAAISSASLLVGGDLLVGALDEISRPRRFFPVPVDASEAAAAAATTTACAVGASAGSGASVDASALGDIWVCDRCTFHNLLAEQRCMACAALRPGAEEEEDDAGPAREEEPHWWCGHCTLMNPLSLMRCDACAEPRDSAVTSPAPPEPPHAVAPMPHSRSSALLSPDLEDEEDDDDDDDDDDDGDDGSNDDYDDDDDDDDDNQTEDSDEVDDDDDDQTSTSEDTSGSEPESEDDDSTDSNLSLFDLGNLGARGDEGLSIQAPDNLRPATPAMQTLSESATGDVLRITAKGYLSTTNIFLTRRDAAQSSGRWTPHDLQVASKKWDNRTDTLLLEHLNAQLLVGKQCFNNPISLNFPTDVTDFRSFHFDELTLLDLQCRALFFEEVNKMLGGILSIVNLRNAEPHSFGGLLRQSNHYCFMNLKQPLLDRAIECTAAHGSGLPAHITLDNFKALASRERGEVEPNNSLCTFVQAFTQLHDRDSRVFRYVFQGDRSFQISFEAEPGIDAGGVFREGVSRIVEDIFSENFALLILCPNGQHSVHMNMEKYVPNPGQTNALALKMFQFVGRLMGMSLRTKMMLPFDFPPTVWKGLLGLELEKEDLASIDAMTSSFLDTLRNCAEDGVKDSTSFEAKYGTSLFFTATCADGIERELSPESATKRVTWENRLEYCDAVEHMRLREFDAQVARMAQGLGEVVPMDALQLFSWQQLEVLVAGSPTFDMVLWKKNTSTSGISSRNLGWFWQVIESLSARDQAGFVRFAWGRSRLPTAKNFTCKMKLSSAGRTSLPVAHTCFFSIELPDYETFEAMKHGILTVVHFGVGGILIS